MVRDQHDDAAAVSSGGAAEWLGAHAAMLAGATSAPTFEQLCTEALPALLGHRAMLAAVGRMSLTECSIARAWNFGCPQALFDEMTCSRALSSRSTLARWVRLEQPLFVGHDDDDDDLPIGHALARHGLRRRAVHGVRDGAASLGSCFAFFGLRADDSAKVAEGLRLLVPFLHVALMGLCREQAAPSMVALTPRERVLIRLVAEGRTNAQIASHWNRSAATVRNQLHGLMTKLEVNSRARLTAVAMQQGLLETTPVGANLAARAGRVGVFTDRASTPFGTNVL